MLAKLKTFAALLGAFFVVAVIVFFKGRAEGIKYIEAEQQRRRLESLKDRKEVDDEVENYGSNDVDNGLARWMRDGPER